MFCSKCGKEIKDGTRFCPGCGAQQSAPVPQKMPVQQTPVQQTPARQSVPVQQPKPKKKSKAGLVFALVLGGMVLLGGIGFGAYYVVQNVLDLDGGSARDEDQDEQARGSRRGRKGEASEEGAAAGSDETQAPAIEETPEATDAAVVVEATEEATSSGTAFSDSNEAFTYVVDGMEKANVSGASCSYTNMGGMYQQADVELTTGMLDSWVYDYDLDGDDELMVLSLQEDGKNDEYDITYYSIYASVYEWDKAGEPKQQGKIPVAANIIGGLQDSLNIRFFVNPNTGYMFVDDTQDWFVSADGESVAVRAIAYDGSVLKIENQESIAGSDFYESGKEASGWHYFLLGYDLDKSYQAVKDRDQFGICAAEENLVCIGKFVMDNSYPFKSNYPEATFKYISAREDDYLVPGFSTSYLSEQDVLDLGLTSAAQLRYGRNEIYARYGWYFDDEELGKYFNSKAWYRAYGRIADEDLTDIEMQNRNLIMNMENARK